MRPPQTHPLAAETQGQPALRPDPAHVERVVESLDRAFAELGLDQQLRPAVALGRIRVVTYQLADVFTTNAHLPTGRRLELLREQIGALLAELVAYDLAGGRTFAGR